MLLPRKREFLSMKVKADVTTSELCKTWPGPEHWGAKTWWEISEAAIGHGIRLTTQEPPGITPLFSIEHPVALEENMVIALESWYGSRSAFPVLLQQDRSEAEISLCGAAGLASESKIGQHSLTEEDSLSCFSPAEAGQGLQFMRLNKWRCQCQIFGLI